MSEDNLEKYIKENRDRFETDKPSSHIWKGIERRLDEKVSFQWLWKAAAVLFFCISAFLLFDKYNVSNQPNVAQEIHKITKEFGDVESYYFQIISDKRDLIYNYDELEEPIDVHFEQDLQKLDAMYEVLKEELKRNPSKKVVDALVLNLLVRIDVLNQEIEKLEGKEEDSLNSKEPQI